MLTSIEDFVRWFGSVNARAVRDFSAVPDHHTGWAPGSGQGEQAWSIAQLAQHMAEGRLFFTEAFCGERGIWDPWPTPVLTKADCIAALDDSYAQMSARLGTVGDDHLTRRVAIVPGEREASGWRVLMMMAEHDIHHRSQIDTYAGLNLWDVPDIFGRSAEWVAANAAREKDPER